MLRVPGAACFKHCWLQCGQEKEEKGLGLGSVSTRSLSVLFSFLDKKRMVAIAPILSDTGCRGDSKLKNLETLTSLLFVNVNVIALWMSKIMGFLLWFFKAPASLQTSEVYSWVFYSFIHDPDFTFFLNLLCSKGCYGLANCGNPRTQEAETPGHPQVLYLKVLGMPDLQSKTLSQNEGKTL